MSKGLFVTGTDTGVGKTVITCGVVALLRSWGIKVGAMKPIATGDRSDAEALRRAAKMDDDMDLINPLFFKAGLAPTVAAAMEHRDVDIERIYHAYWYLQKKYDILIVEGIGGVKVPIGESTYVLDLIQALRLPVLVVTRQTLGTLNHTLLTLDALEREKIEAWGVIFNGRKGRSLAERTNPETLQDHTPVPVFGEVPYKPAFVKNPETLGVLLERMPRLAKTLRRLGPPA